MSDNRLTQTEVSLNPASEKLVKIKINGVELQVPNGENIIEAANSIGVDIPFFCYHPRLSKGDAANCRMCLVECATVAPDGTIRKMPKPQTACTMPASEGLIVETKTDRVVKDRKAILEFLLINHPLDCPVCDRGGECPLQNNTLFYDLRQVATSKRKDTTRKRILFPNTSLLIGNVAFSARDAPGFQKTSAETRSWRCSNAAQR